MFALSEYGRTFNSRQVLRNQTLALHFMTAEFALLTFLKYWLNVISSMCRRHRWKSAADMIFFHLIEG